MRSSFLKTLFIAFFCLFAASAQAQTFKLEELISSFNSPEYPERLFEMVEAKGFYRVDKEWLPTCDRVIYAFDVKEGKPGMFVNPMNCFKPLTNDHYPVRFKNETQLQFQKSTRAEFDKLSAVIRKQCKAATIQNGTESGAKTKTGKKAYLHEASGVKIIIEDSAPVAFIYLIK